VNGERVSVAGRSWFDAQGTITRSANEVRESTETATSARAR